MLNLFLIQLKNTANVTEGESIPAWSFDEERGIWVEEGNGIVSVSPGGDISWTFNASHLNWWNCDRPWTDKNCINVDVSHIQNGGAPFPLSGALVNIEGVSYNYYTSVLTAPTGQTCLEAKGGELNAIQVIHSQFSYDSGEGIVFCSFFSSFCALNSLLWTPHLIGFEGQCEELSFLCKRSVVSLLLYV